jgi:hypothetical protein
MDVTGGLADAVSKITAALPGVEANEAALLTQALAGIQAEIDHAEAAEEKLLALAAVALHDLLGADTVAALLPQLLGAGSLAALLERGITIKLGVKTSA